MSVVDVRSASSTEQYARTKKLEKNYETLRRKYAGLDNLYKEAKRQNAFLKSELEKKSEQWREWHKWWSRQKRALKPRASESPVRTLTSLRSKASNRDSTTLTADGKGINAAEGSKMDTESITEDEIDESELFRTTFSPDTVAARRETQTTPSKSHRRRSHPEDTVQAAEQRSQIKQDLQISPADRNVKIEDHSPEASRVTTVIENGRASSRKREVIEILESPEIAVSRIGRIPDMTRPITPISLPPSVRPQSAPVQNTRKSRLSTPLSTSPSVGNKKKVKEYPNMKYWTEDGTDGVNPRPPSPVEEDDGGLLVSLLRGQPPPRPGTASPLAQAGQRLRASTPETKAKTARVRELSEVDSDSASGRESTDAERESKRHKGIQTPSESKLRRQILSPDLASRNKGRGRYAASVMKNDDAPRLGAFTIDPTKNHGVSHPFAEVVRGKDARRSLTGSSCPDCDRVYYPTFLTLLTNSFINWLDEQENRILISVHMIATQ